MKIRSLLIALVSVGAVAMASAQDVVVVNGVKYAIHDVQRGETLYALSRRYGVTIEEITSANQVLSEGLKVGQRIGCRRCATTSNGYSQDSQGRKARDTLFVG